MFKEKSLMAETAISKDIIQVVFDYARVKPDIFQRLQKTGFEVWGAPGLDISQNQAMLKTLISCGGSGMLFTRWLPCIPANRDTLLTHLRARKAIHLENH